MDLPLTRTAIDFSRRRRRWILLLAAFGFSGYGVYNVYHLPSVSKKRKKLFKLFKSLISVAEAVSSSADTISLVSSDLNRFLRSNSDEIPTSLKQMSKIARSEEFSGSVSRVSEALTVGILRGFSSGDSTSKTESTTSSSFPDRFLDKLFSTAGTGFVSAVAGSFARNLVISFYSSRSSTDSDDQTEEPGSRWIHLICRDECRELIADSIQRFVSTATAVYLDKTMEINTYDELFSGLTNPKHESKVKDIVVSVCNGAVETLVKTSHQVLTNSNSSSSVDEVKIFQQKEEFSPENDRRSSIDEKAKGSGGWVDKVSSTLAVPSNRRLVLDVTGRVTCETVRSFLDFVMQKLYHGARRSVSVAREEMVERGLEVVRYISAKSMVIYTICLSLCMHMLTGTRVLTPA